MNTTNTESGSLGFTTINDLIAHVRNGIGEAYPQSEWEPRVRAWYMQRAGGYEDITESDMDALFAELNAATS